MNGGGGIKIQEPGGRQNVSKNPTSMMKKVLSYQMQQLYWMIIFI